MSAAMACRPIPSRPPCWYAAAAKQGNRKAMHNLAVAYAQGSGVTKNFAVAAQWFTRAAELGLRDFAVQSGRAL